MLNLVLFGPPGAGKGTQSNLLIDKYDLIHLSTGDILRSEIAEGTKLGLEAKSIMDRGDLVTDEIVIGMISSKLDNNPNANGFIFDGFPRTIPQAQALVNRDIDIDSVEEIHVPDEDIIERMSGRRMHQGSGRNYHIVYNPPKTDGKDDITGEDLIQREDDKPETVKDRLKVYENQTSPLINFYKEMSVQGKLEYVSVSGTSSPEKVSSEILSWLS